MSIDDRELGVLLEQSQDLHADSMRHNRAALDDLVDLGRADRAHREPDQPAESAATVRPAFVAGGLLAAAGVGAAFATLVAAPAFAASSKDVQILQTAASIETLAVATYQTALTLDFIGGASANAVVKAFATKTMSQHADHLKAFNAAAQQLGGKPQTTPDPVLLNVVNQAKPGLSGPGPVVDLAIELENGAAATYVKDVEQLTSKDARSVTASIMGVEAQHVAILNAVKALVAGGAASLIALPPDASKLPAAAGSVGFPDSFYKTDAARPAKEGAVQ
jgi:rubrerythrin